MQPRDTAELLAGLMRRLAVVLVLLGLVGDALAQGEVPTDGDTRAIDFEKQVWPILESKCIQCHSSPRRAASGRLKKPKAGVQLDSAAGIRSSQRGKVVVAGRPGSSLLYLRVTLPEGDDDIMPPTKQGAGLTKAQTDLIKRWIEQGANYGTWRGNESGNGSATGADRVDKPKPSDSVMPKVMPPVTGLAFAPDGKSVVACSQVGVRVYDWPALQLQRTFAATAHNLHDLAFSPAGDRLAIAGGNPSRVGMVETISWPGQEAQVTVREQEDSVQAMVWRDETTIASASLDHSIVLADTRSGTVLRRLAGHSRGVTALCFLRGGKILVSAGIDQSVRVWDVDKSELIRSLSQHTRPVHDLALRPAKAGLPMVASAAADRTIRFWQPTIGRMVRYIRLASAPLDIAWLHDGVRIVAACADGRVRVIDAETVVVIGDLPAVGGLAYSLAVHPTDGSVIVGGQGGELRRVVLRASQPEKAP